MNANIPQSDFSFDLTRKSKWSMAMFVQLPQQR